MFVMCFNGLLITRVVDCVWLYAQFIYGSSGIYICFCTCTLCPIKWTEILCLATDLKF